jgi:hypothetical protein
MVLVPLSKKGGVAAWIHNWVFYSAPLVLISVFVPGPCWFYYYSFKLWFEVEYYDSSSIALYAHYCGDYSWSFVLSNEL